MRQPELQACVLAVLGRSTDSTAALPPGPEQMRFTGRVLVAEDNGVNQLVARAMLRALGLDCEIADDGAAALEAGRRGGFDLVLMDCQMPTVDGYEATRRIREEEDRRALNRVPVVALTANVVAGVRELCDAAGMDDYLSKPYGERALAQVLARWLRAQDAIEGNATLEQPSA